MILSSPLALPVVLSLISIQPETSPITEIVVSGSFAGNKDTLALSTAVVGREDIEKLAPLDISSLIATLPGVHIASRGESGLAAIALRGGESNFTVITVDGVQVNDPTNSRGGIFDFSQLNPDMVERIELVHGGLSALYGSDALSGVINIVTRQISQGLHGDLRGELGGRGLRQLHAGLSYGDPSGASFGLRGGIKNVDELGQAAGFVEQRYLTAKASIQADNAQLDSSLSYTNTEGQRFPADAGGPENASASDLELVNSSQLIASARVKVAVSQHVDFRLLFGYTLSDEALDSPAVAAGATSGLPATLSTTQFERLDLTALYDHQVSSALAVTLGVAFEKETGVNDSVLDFGFPLDAGFSLSRDTTSVFADSVLTVNETLEFSGGVRFDRFSGAGGQATTRLGVRLNVLPLGGVLSGHWGEGFKLPSFFALAHPLVGNPTLRPESSKNIEVSASWPINEAGSFRVSLFKNRFTDLVEFDPTLFQIINLSSTKAQGIEAALGLDVSDALSLAGQVSFTDTSIVGQQGRPLQQRPRWLASLTAHYAIDDWISVSTNWRSVGERFDFSVPTGFAPLAAYNVINISVAIRLTDNAKLSVSIDNVLDRAYSDVIGYRENALVRTGIALNW